MESIHCDNFRASLDGRSHRDSAYSKKMCTAVSNIRLFLTAKYTIMHKIQSQHNCTDVAAAYSVSARPKMCDSSQVFQGVALLLERVLFGITRAYQLHSTGFELYLSDAIKN